MIGEGSATSVTHDLIPDANSNADRDMLRPNVTLKRSVSSTMALLASMLSVVKLNRDPPFSACRAIQIM